MCSKVIIRNCHHHNDITGRESKSTYLYPSINSMFESIFWSNDFVPIHSLNSGDFHSFSLPAHVRIEQFYRCWWPYYKLFLFLVFFSFNREKNYVRFHRPLNEINLIQFHKIKRGKKERKKKIGPMRTQQRLRQII